ncbi:MAG: pyrroloquinoline quinone biosynthesis peptide chaperone PqqD [Gammaproteobacteria bacterium]|nr:pyrroloquinoline quinone biosynthesis peptide chaperone PqqD [Gammaproteobacteria bacterium]
MSTPSRTSVASGTNPPSKSSAPGEPRRIAATAKPAVGRGYRLQWEQAQQAHVLLYPEGMVKLNDSAGAIMSRCDGERTIGQIVEDLEKTYDASGLTGEVTAFVEMAVAQKWLEVRE